MNNSMEYYSNKTGEGRSISTPKEFSPLILIPCDPLKELFQEKLNEFVGEISKSSLSNTVVRIPLDFSNLIPRHYLIDIFSLTIFSKEFIFNSLVYKGQHKNFYIKDESNNSFESKFCIDKIKILKRSNIRKNNSFNEDNENDYIFVKTKDKEELSKNKITQISFNENELKSILNQKILEVRTKYFDIVDKILYETRSLILTAKINFKTNIIYENNNSLSLNRSLSDNNYNLKENGNIKKISQKQLRKMNYNYIMREWIKEIDKFLSTNFSKEVELKARILMRTKLKNVIKFQQSALIYISVFRAVLCVKRYKQNVFKFVNELFGDFLQLNIQNKEIKLILENKDSHKITSAYKDIFIRNINSDDFFQMFVKNKAQFIIIIRLLIKIFNDLTVISQNFESFYRIIFSLSTFSLFKLSSEVIYIGLFYEIIMENKIIKSITNRFFENYTSFFQKIDHFLDFKNLYDIIKKKEEFDFAWCNNNYIPGRFKNLLKNHPKIKKFNEEIIQRKMIEEQKLKLKQSLIQKEGNRYNWIDGANDEVTSQISENNLTNSEHLSPAKKRKHKKRKKKDNNKDKDKNKIKDNSNDQSELQINEGNIGKSNSMDHLSYDEIYDEEIINFKKELDSHSSKLPKFKPVIQEEAISQLIKFYLE